MKVCALTLKKNLGERARVAGLFLRNSSYSMYNKHCVLIMYYKMSTIEDENNRVARLVRIMG